MSEFESTPGPLSGHDVSPTGPILPISALGPDSYREVAPGQQTFVIVRRDESVSGWTVAELPGFTATITCNGEVMYAAPNWSEFKVGNYRYGAINITEVYDSAYAVHLSYVYDDETYEETFNP